MSCLACGSADDVRRFSLQVDGAPLRLAPDLCRPCGDAYLIRVGRAMGEIIRLGQSGHTISPGDGLMANISAAFRAGVEAERPLPDKSGRSYEAPTLTKLGPDESAAMRATWGHTLTIRDVPACTNCNRTGHLAEDCSAGEVIVDGPGDPCDHCGRVPCICG